MDSDKRRETQPEPDKTKRVTTTDQREFDLLDYETLEIDLNVAGVELYFNYDYSGQEGVVDFYVPNSKNSPSQALSCGLAHEKSENAKGLKTEIRIPEGESSDVKFNLSKRTLFIIRTDAHDSSIWILSYALLGDEMAALRIRKPETEQPRESPEAEPREITASGTYFCDYGEDDLTGAINWLREVVGCHSYGDLAGFVDYLTANPPLAADALEHLRLALFIESDVFAQAYKLYCLRDNLKHFAKPEELIADLLKEYGPPDEEQKGEVATDEESKAT